MQSENELGELIWYPENVFNHPDDYKFALVVLNQPILLRREQVLFMWEKAQITVTVDGGTNQWIEYLGDEASNVLTGKCKKYLPTLVTGDMDSISPKLLDELKQIDTKIIYTLDTLETDYTKAIIQLTQYASNNNINLHGIQVLAETSGRLDQIISNVNTLYKCGQLSNKLPVIQLASNSLTWLLQPGMHKIIIPDEVLKSKSWCSLIPFGDANNCITTTGLKWNLNKMCMKFGELISTSNTYSDHPEVTVNTNVPLIWTMGIEALTN